MKSIGNSYGTLSNRTDSITSKYPEQGIDFLLRCFLFVLNQPVHQEDSGAHVCEVSEAICDAFQRLNMCVQIL